MKKLIALLMVAVFAVAFCACAPAAETPAADAPAADAPAADAPAAEAPAADEPAAEEPAADAPAAEEPAAEVNEIAVIVKTPSSQSWQYFLSGARKAAEELGITITEHGATDETAIEEQISIMEDVIATKPDGIVLVPCDADALVAPVEQAMGEGIPVVIGEAVNTENYTSFVDMDSYNGGCILAQEMVDCLNERGVALEGKVLIVSAVPVATCMARDQGFKDTMAELAPNVEILGDNYVDNDTQKSMDLCLDTINANPDLIGIFADNNMTGDGLALALAETGMGDKLACVAYDANPTEVEAVQKGDLQALMMIGLSEMGYVATKTAYAAANGEEVEYYQNAKEVLITAENVDSDEVQSQL